MPAPLLALLLICCAASAPQTPQPKPLPETPLVQLQLLSELDALHAGDEFLIGLRHTLAPSWHIYWKNPGDTGLPTRPTLRAPDGFEVGPALFPAPQRIELPGDITSYAYETEVVFFWRVKAPAELGEAQHFEFRAESEWLVCKESCQRGDGKAALSVRRARKDEEVQRELQPFGTSLARLPRPLSALKGSKARLEDVDDGVALEIEVPLDAALRWFPETEDGVALERMDTERGKQRTRLVRRYNLRPSQESPSPHIQGVLVVEHGETTDYYELNLERPRAAEEKAR